MNRLNVIYENDNVLVINKQAGVLVHRAKYSCGETIVDLVLKKYSNMKDMKWDDPGRAGIVHRLDKDTLGLLIIAKNPKSLQEIQDQFRRHQVEKKYFCLVKGKTKQDDIIVKKISWKAGTGKMTTGVGKEAKTKYKVIDYYKDQNGNIYSFLDVEIISGRTHQIRVHFKSQGFPVVGDQLYSRGKDKKLWAELGLNRQFLQAYFLKFKNPSNNQNIHFKIPLAKDLENILNKLVKINE